MKINEQQLIKLFNVAINVATLPPGSTYEESYKNKVANLLDEIISQQSSELIEVE